MFRIPFLILLCWGSAINAASLLPLWDSSYSGDYGGNGGKRFSHAANQQDGPITAIRIHIDSNYIVGLQVRYGRHWSEYIGGSSGEREEIFLHKGESVIQVTGRYGSYVQRLVFITDQNRTFIFGNDAGTTFNAAPIFKGTVLRYFTGRASSYINSIGFHWGDYPKNVPNCAERGNL
uniref:Jacalin-type lectin domain-containing protein n=1 Tax=Anolis carolinensis TaxID=28377 RepID=A0A803T7Q7_ANOCA